MTTVLIPPHCSLLPPYRTPPPQQPFPAASPSPSHHLAPPPAIPLRKRLPPRPHAPPYEAADPTPSLALTLPIPVALTVRRPAAGPPCLRPEERGGGAVVPADPPLAFGALAVRTLLSLEVLAFEVLEVDDLPCFRLVGWPFLVVM